MKKRAIMTVAMTLLTTLGVSTNIVSAADTTGKDSDASVAVAAGDLSIEQVPNIAFSSSVADIANGATTAGLASGGDIKTADNRGLGAQTEWTLTAKPTALTDGAGHHLNITSLTINGNQVATIDGNTETTIASGHNEGSTVTALDSKNTSIALGKDSQVYAGNYTGKITWTLTGKSAATEQPAE
ncbi:WxL domain-containing protein [Lactobacillus sp. ESL0684]|uniref:WxL domain-containing protein n=1 Tax=unclassified Lactobacillus TaxID=2620435 RepID=UPI0023F8E9E6|nr:MULTISPECIES: WxL domain-containing protein [unclassified Lactobacillus]WEV40017.1 WxL domain-containing protein [Lactobacillus sp. ESL0681]WEV43443.1 WxL domain-containing protein [Lactobacillus sp. ESL0684]